MCGCSQSDFTVKSHSTFGYANRPETDHLNLPTCDKPTPLTLFLWIEKIEFVITQSNNFGVHLWFSDFSDTLHPISYVALQWKHIKIQFWSYVFFLKTRNHICLLLVKMIFFFNYPFPHPPSFWQPSSYSVFLWVYFCLVLFILFLLIPHISEVIWYLSLSD